MRLANSLPSNNLSNGCIQNSKWALRTDLHHINRRKSKVLQANHCALDGLEEIPRRSVREIVHKTANLKCISNWSIDYLPTIHQVPVQNIATALLRLYESTSGRPFVIGGILMRIRNFPGNRSQKQRRKIPKCGLGLESSLCTVSHCRWKYN